ncbi:type I restriction enzyme, S subunit [Actinokineospora alba]|uniref:Type I restriction enzyme, S subunit n=1 Tax=Actinokineospora alba TaxID=504798 RepID=A0A1H0VIN6_9PSEU|nr:restriction endonuclease subunit S [Actinokineospora alba]TDP67695.1 type I restriction enzyme S subunit [Actinokineospora alba]SDJ28095.1 type I restriction enzyme, S subunit [Actinokineospora alba]SDP78310.1 type I restriction enzyme, S subunit [Actinokineospora alba]
MKLVDLSNPVTSEWLADQSFRLDPSPYLSGALEARKLLERLPNTVTLASVTRGFNGGIFNGPKFSRVYLDDNQHAVPFLGSTDMLEMDFTFLPKLSKGVATRLPYLEVQPGMTLVSCSGTIGRMAYVRPDMTGIWSSQHVMKVAPNPERISAGYLYSFLRSRYGVPMIASSAYGAIIQHIEPHHIADLPVPRFDVALEHEIHDLVEQSAELRAGFQTGLVTATEDFFKSVGLPELIDLRWHQRERDLGFEINGLTSTTLRALNFAPRARHIIERLGAWRDTATLGEICDGGTLRTGARFKRIDADPDHGVRLVGQRQAFWIRPEGRWISASQAPADIMQKDETILVAAHGTLGENEVYSRSILVTGSWLENAFSQDFVRVLSGDPDVPGAYLFAFFRSEAAFRIFRSLSVGGKQQEYHTKLMRELPIPLAVPADRDRIAETVRKAYRDRDRADVLEDQALALLTTAIEEASA